MRGERGAGEGVGVQQEKPAWSDRRANPVIFMHPISAHRKNDRRTESTRNDHIQIGFALHDVCGRKCVMSASPRTTKINSADELTVPSTTKFHSKKHNCQFNETRLQFTSTLNDGEHLVLGTEKNSAIDELLKRT